MKRANLTILSVSAFRIIPRFSTFLCSCSTVLSCSLLSSSRCVFVFHSSSVCLLSSFSFSFSSLCSWLSLASLLCQKIRKRAPVMTSTQAMAVSMATSPKSNNREMLAHISQGLHSRSNRESHQNGSFSLPALPPAETAASGWTGSSPPRFSSHLSGPPRPAAFLSEECGQITIPRRRQHRQRVGASRVCHLQLLCSLLQKPLRGSELLDGLIQLIHFQVLLLHLSLQLISLQDQILHLRISRESLLFRPGLVFTQLNVAL